MSKFLITGGAGFIGGNFCHFAVNEYPDDSFVCIDALTYAGNLQTLEPIMNKKNFKFIHENICNREKIYEIFEKEKFDYVINFAAESHVDRSIDNPEIFLKTNILGTQVLLDACRIYGIKKFHQVSTDEVYGDLPLDREDLTFDESYSLNASSPYSASKASADLLVLSYYRTYNLPVNISRCSNNYGPYQFPEKLIPLIIKKALNNEKLPIYGNGDNVRDWLHVFDHCRAIDLIIRSNKVGEVFNIGGHNEKSNLQVVKTILDYLKKPYSLIEFVKDRPGHDLRYAINPNKLKTELGWEPIYNFDSGIKATIEWNINNKEWLDNIVSGEYLNWMEKHYNKGE